MTDWRGNSAIPQELRARCARLGKKWPERVGLTRGVCPASLNEAPDGQVPACACDGSCLRPATAEELQAELIARGIP